VITPRDYDAHPIPNDVLYKQYFYYWKSWNDELVAALSERETSKKIVFSAEQTLSHLVKMRSYLKEEKGKDLDLLIEEARSLSGAIIASPVMLPSQYDAFRYRAERLLARVNRGFDSRKVKEMLL
jgi:hypothetical protein